MTPQELQALADASLLGSLTCKEDVLFMLRQIRGARNPRGTGGDRCSAANQGPVSFFFRLLAQARGKSLIWPVGETRARNAK